MNSSFLLEPLENIPAEADISDNDIVLLQKGLHSDPFQILGPHSFTSSESPLGCWIVRVWRKDAKEVFLTLLENQIYMLPSFYDNRRGVPLIQRSKWLFQLAFKVQQPPGTNASTKAISLHEHHFLYNLHISYYNDQENMFYTTRDPYNFSLLLPESDLQAFSSSAVCQAENLMGSHKMILNDVEGVCFSVWTPTARVVSVVGGWNQWDSSSHPMRQRIPYGVWEIFIPHIQAKECYAYSILCQNNNRFTKIDPYAQEFQIPPESLSIISDCDDAFKEEADQFPWEDHEWIQKRQLLSISKQMFQEPMSIYEVHLPSWMRGDNNRYLNFRELAHRLIQHLQKLHMTHIEFLPITHHPYEGSWGYQSTGYYAPYSRLGSPDDLKYLINELHKHNIGVLLDLPLGHFARDSWALANYDGSPCYECSDLREAEHRSWGTLAFNFSRNEVRSFLFSVVHYWIHRYHFDGIRVDAVSSMLYKNFGRNENEWIPNEFGGCINLHAVSFLKEMNRRIHERFPGVFMIAEESTSWQNVTKTEDGLGFDAKWDLGWMNDTLSYLCTPHHERPSRHNKLTFRNLYVSHERWILPLSHDEVVHGKGSLLDKCGFYGTPYDVKLPTMRTLLTLQVTMPGRPLLFMGAEYAQGREWRSYQSLDWHEAYEPQRLMFTTYVADLFLLYSTEVALYREEDPSTNFQWCDCNNAEDCLIIWLRHDTATKNMILIACNFSSTTYHGYRIGLHESLSWQVVLNSDEAKYSGSMNGPVYGTLIQTESCPRYVFPYSIPLDIPAYGSILLKALSSNVSESVE